VAIAVAIRMSTDLPGAARVGDFSRVRRLTIAEAHGIDSESKLVRSRGDCSNRPAGNTARLGYVDLRGKTGLS
jgi:hypothetical protein